MTRIAPHIVGISAILFLAAIALGLAGCTGIKLPDLPKPAPNWPMND
jgi:hypothetical protein